MWLVVAFVAGVVVSFIFHDKIVEQVNKVLDKVS